MVRAGGRGRDPLARLGWFERIIADANLLFDEAFWQAHAAMAGRSRGTPSDRGQGRSRPVPAATWAAWAGTRDEYLALLALCRADEPACRHPSPPSMPGRGWDALQQLLVRFDEASCWLLYNKALMSFVCEGAAARPHLAAAMGSIPMCPPLCWASAACPSRTSPLAGRQP